MAPRGKQPPSRIDSQGLSAYREELIDLGIVREEITLTRPRVSEVRDKTAELIARGYARHVVDGEGRIAREPLP